MDKNKQVNFSAEIVSGCSMGNILLYENILEYIDGIHSNYKIIENKYAISSLEERICYNVEGIITITTIDSGKIVSLGCNKLYSGYYKNYLYPGIKFGELCERTSLQRVFNGAIIIDNDFGIAFTLPPPYDEIGDSITMIPKNTCLNEIYVADYSSWNPDAYKKKAY